MKVNFLRYLIAFLCLCSLAVSLCACGGSKLDGRWVIENEEDLSSPNYRYFPEYLELFKEGTGTFNIPYYRGEESIEWTAENGRLKVNNSIVYDFTYDYSISGKTLTLTYDDVSITYVKD